MYLEVDSLALPIDSENTASIFMLYAMAAKLFLKGAVSIYILQYIALPMILSGLLKTYYT